MTATTETVDLSALTLVRLRSMDDDALAATFKHIAAERQRSGEIRALVLSRLLSSVLDEKLRRDSVA